MIKIFLKGLIKLSIVFSSVILLMLLFGCSSKNTLSNKTISTENKAADLPSTSFQPTAAAAQTTPEPTPSATSNFAPQPAYNPQKATEAENLYEQGFQLYLSSKYDDAIKIFDKAIQMDEMCYKAYNGKGIALCFKGSYKDGMLLINKALQIKPDFTYSNFNMALAYKLQKNYAQSLVWFDKAISIDSNDTWSYFGKACIYAEWNDTSKALENLKKAIEIDASVKEAAKNEHDLDNIKSNSNYLKLVE